MGVQFDHMAGRIALLPTTSAVENDRQPDGPLIGNALMVDVAVKVEPHVGPLDEKGAQPLRPVQVVAWIGGWQEGKVVGQNDIGLWGKAPHDLFEIRAEAVGKETAR